MADNKSEPKNSTKHKNGYFHRSISYKVAAIQELDRGETSTAEFMQKHNIAISSITRWRQQVKSYLEGEPTTKRLIFTNSIKLKVVRAITYEGLTINEARKEYGIKNRRTIQNWCEKYSCELVEEKDPEVSMNSKMTKDDDIKKLEEKLEDARLKILGLETMIDVAENQFKIAIRKKSGTKQ